MAEKETREKMVQSKSLPCSRGTAADALQLLELAVTKFLLRRNTKKFARFVTLNTKDAEHAKTSHIICPDCCGSSRRSMIPGGIQIGICLFDLCYGEGLEF